jgi:hypothetical protein
MLDNIILESMRIAFVRVCIDRGFDANEAAKYFDNRVISEGWTDGE